MKGNFPNKIHMKKKKGLEWDTNVCSNIISPKKECSVKVTLKSESKNEYANKVMVGVHSNKFFYLEQMFLYEGMGIYAFSNNSQIGARFYGQINNLIQKQKLVFKKNGDYLIITVDITNNVVYFIGKF